MLFDSMPLGSEIRTLSSTPGPHRMAGVVLRQNRETPCCPVGPVEASCEFVMRRTDHFRAEQSDSDATCMPAHRAHRRVLGGGICGLLRLALILLAMSVQGLLATEAKGEQAVKFAYDADGLLLTEVQGEQATRHQYDALGRRIRRVDSARSERFEYGPAGLTGLTDGTGGSHRFAHDGFGRRVEWHRPGGTAFTQRWDTLGRLEAEALHLPGGVPALERTLTWSEDDTLTAIAERDGGRDGGRDSRQQYAYDDAGRLIEARTDGGPPRQYQFDAADNLLAEPGGPDRSYQADRLLADADGAQYQYDGDGRLIAVEGRKGTLRLWFDDRDRLARVHTADDRVVHHRYDALGRRVETLAEQPDGTATLERFSYDGDRLARRTLLDPATEAELRDEAYTYDPEFERPLFRLVRQGDTEQVQYYTTDQRGAVTRLTDAQGKALWTGRADPYGRYREEGPEAGQQPLRLAGQVHDTATGLCHHRFRVYDPQSARFISHDPIGLAGGGNAFYYPTNPVSHSDPLGLQGCDRLNLGSGDNPMEGATNADIRRTSSTDVVLHPDWNTTGHLPFADGSFDEVHVVNPYGFNPVHPEVARVLRPGGQLFVTGSPANKYARPVGADAASSAGLNQVSVGPMIPQHSFGTQAYTNGNPLPTTANHTTTVYQKPES